SLWLDRDRYSAATVSTRNDFIGFVLQNQRAGSPHTTHATLTGLAAGTYTLSVGGAAAGTVTAAAGKPTVVPLSVGADATLAVQIGTPCAVSAGTGGSPGGGGRAGGTGGAAAGGSTGSGSTGGSTGSGGAVSITGTGGRDANGGGQGTGGMGESHVAGGCSCEAAGRPGGGPAALLLLAVSLWARVRQRPAGRPAPRKRRRQKYEI